MSAQAELTRKLAELKKSISKANFPSESQMKIIFIDAVLEKEGVEFFMLAIKKGALSMLKFFKSKNFGFEKIAKTVMDNKEFWTLLTPKITEIIFKNTALLVDYKLQNGKSLFWKAAEFGNVTLMKILVENGAGSDSKTIS